MTVLHAVNLAPEYFPGPARDTPCESSGRPLPFSPALQELRSQQERRLEAFSQHAIFRASNYADRIEDGDPATESLSGLLSARIRT